MEPCSPHGHSSIIPYLGPVSLLVAIYNTKTETLLCSSIEAREHTLQLLVALEFDPSPGAGDPRVTALLSGLAYI